MTAAPTSLGAPTRERLARVFRLKYGAPGELGWGPAMRARFGYYNPDEYYEALLDAMVTASTRWLDVGCGRELFPSNRPLARELADRCARLVGVDPDDTLRENRYVHEAVLQPFEQYDGGMAHDLVTLRMVAEHVRDPEAVARSVARASAPGAAAVVYTVSGRSPVPLLTRVVPMAARHRIKRWLWRTDEKDTFPTAFRMNSRRRLRQLLGDVGFDEVLFLRLDDCRTLSRFRSGQWLELTVRRALRAVGLGYPEACLLGVYRRRN